MTFLKQSTTVTVQLGPALDKTDGVTEETGLSPTVEVSKAGAAFAARNSATAITHDANGWYRVELNATDTGTLGPLIAKFDDAATHLPVWREFMVVPANVYDSLVSGSDKLDVAVVELLAAVATEIADALLKRDMSALSGEAARSPLNALRVLRNKWSISGSTLTVTKEDDSTTAFTATVTGTPGADPVTAVDPT